MSKSFMIVCVLAVFYACVDAAPGRAVDTGEGRAPQLGVNLWTAARQVAARFPDGWRSTVSTKCRPTCRALAVERGWYTGLRTGVTR